MTSANGRNAKRSSAMRRSSPLSCDASGAALRRPIFTRYSGVTDNEIVSPIASWKPSFALSRRMTGCFMYARW